MYSILSDEHERWPPDSGSADASSKAESKFLDQPGIPFWFKSNTYNGMVLSIWSRTSSRAAKFQKRELWRLFCEEIACFTFGKLGSKDDRFADDDVDGMAQRAASQVVVDEGRDYSGFGQAEPNGHVFRSIVKK